MVVYQLNWLFHSVQIEKKRAFFSYEISWKKCCNSKIKSQWSVGLQLCHFHSRKTCLEKLKIAPSRNTPGKSSEPCNHGILTLLTPPPRSGRYPPLGWTSLSTVVKFISLPRRCWSMTFEKVRIVRLLANAWILHLQ